MKLHRLLLTTLSALLCQAALAINPESSRILVHTLNYLGGDYKNAVANGRVLSADEYAEMGEFCESAEKYFKEFSTEWSDTDSAQVGALIEALVDGVHRKADPEFVADKAARAKLKIIAITGLTTYPFRYPDLANGKKLYLAECAKCHGFEGYGDGPEGKELDPKPRNFHDKARLDGIAPAHAFNTIRLGVQGTGMQAHPGFEDDEVWDMAFYVISLRYTGLPATAPVQLPPVSLEQIATESDNDLRQQLHLTAEQLASLRLKQSQPSNDHFLQTAEEYLDKSLTSYNNARGSEALRYASLAYLEGIEPVELHIKATDPELSERMEQQFMHIRKMITENRSPSELADSITAAKTIIHQASDLLQKKDYSFWMALLMSMSILLREGLEAFLVILIILSILKAAGLTAPVKWVHVGWVSAILVGVLLWMVSGQLIARLGGTEMIEGVISMIAVLMLLYIGFWLHGKSEISKWKDYVSSKVKNAMSEGSIAGMVSLSFFVVFREVFESVLFLSALNIEAGGRQSQAIVLGVLLAFVLVIAFAVVMLRFSARLPIPTLFKISLLVMGILAVVLMGKGIHAFQEISYLPVHGIPFIRMELLGIFPTLETTVGQLLTLLLVLFINTKKSAR